MRLSGAAATRHQRHARRGLVWCREAAAAAAARAATSEPKKRGKKPPAPPHLSVAKEQKVNKRERERKRRQKVALTMINGSRRNISAVQSGSISQHHRTPGLPSPPISHLGCWDDITDPRRHPVETAPTPVGQTTNVAKSCQ